MGAKGRQTMVKGKISGLMIIVFLLLVVGQAELGHGILAAGPAGPTGAVIGEISFFMGDATINHQGSTIWTKITLNEKLQSGDKLRTGKESRLEIRFANGSIVRIDENTQYQLSMESSSAGGENSKILSDLSFGRIWANIRTVLLGTPSTQLEVKSPTAVMAVRGTIVRFDAAEKSSDIFVYRGKVDVAAIDRGGIIPLKGPRQVEKPSEVSGPSSIQGPQAVSMDRWLSIVAGQMVHVGTSGTYEQKAFDTNKTENSWVKWNKERDGQLEGDKK
jgi:hypothetical protein